MTPGCHRQFAQWQTTQLAIRDIHQLSCPTPIEDAASSTLASTPANDSASTTVAANPSSVSTPAVEPPPQGLTLVHIAGTKYTDYFTDGTTVTSYPGDPHIDSHFDVPNAPNPIHAGLTWDHTSGGYLYDTPSDNLEVGEYAVQPNGSYIENAPPFVSSTSTPVTTGVASPTVRAASTSAVPVTLTRVHIDGNKHTFGYRHVVHRTAQHHDR